MSASRRISPARALVLLGVLVSSLAAAPSAHAAVPINCNPPTVDIGETTNCTANADSARGPINYDFSSDAGGPSQSGSDNTASGSFSASGSQTVRVTVTYAVPDGGGEIITDSGQTEVSVIQPNRPPTVSEIGCVPVGCNPISGQPVTLSVSATDPDGNALTFAWSAGCTSGAAQATCTYATSGVRTATVTVSDGTATVSRSVTVSVQNQLPTAGFTFPRFGPGQQVTLTSTSSDPDGTINRYEWDLGDGSGFRSTGTTARLTTSSIFAATTVRHRVRDNSNTFSAPFETRVVPNDTPPTPSFSFRPVPPGAGQQVIFTSTSADVEGAIANYAWDLDGNGTFETDTGATPSVSHTFPRAGSYRVSLRVSDASGQRAISTQAVAVNATATVAASAASAALAGGRRPLLRPFPVVRLRGTLTRTGARIRLLSVQAPTGARVTVRCKGRSCGKRHSQALRSRSSRSLRFTRYHRHLRAGTVLQVFVAKAGTIGKYVRFTIRKSKPPLRRDSCVVATSRTPSRCPSG